MCAAHQQGHFHFSLLLIHSNKQPLTKAFAAAETRRVSRDRTRLLGFSVLIPSFSSARTLARMDAAGSSHETSDRVNGSRLLRGHISQTVHLHLCLPVFHKRSSLPLFPSPGRTFPISPTDPITNCFLTGSERPCSAEEAGASPLLCCDQTLRYTPTDH